MQNIRSNEVPAYFSAIKRTFPNKWEEPPSTYTPPGTNTSLTYTRAAEIQLYNGASVVRSLLTPFNNGTTDFYRSCWKFDETASSGNRWSFVANTNNYVYKIIHDEFEKNKNITE